MKKNIILLDCIPAEPWLFKEKLEKDTSLQFECICSDTHNFQGQFMKFVRYLSYFTLPLKFVFNRKKIGVIVAWQQFYGLLFSFWMRLFHLKKENKLIIMTFIYKEKNGLIGKVYLKFMRYIVTSGYIDKFICFSQKECEHYSKTFDISQVYFSSCELEVEDRYSLYKNEIKEGDYYLAAGRSNRDYKYLCEEFGKIKKRRLIVLCDDLSIACAPSNIEFRKNVYGEEYMKLLAGCKAAIIPLRQGCISAGQLAIIQSLMFGKICVVTKTATTCEYVKDNVNALLIENREGELCNIVEQIERGAYAGLNINARKTYLEKFSGTETAALIASLLTGSEGKK